MLKRGPSAAKVSCVITCKCMLKRHCMRALLLLFLPATSIPPHKSSVHDIEYKPKLKTQQNSRMLVNTIKLPWLLIKHSITRRVVLDSMLLIVPEWTSQGNGMLVSMIYERAYRVMCNQVQ